MSKRNDQMDQITECQESGGTYHQSEHEFLVSAMAQLKDGRPLKMKQEVLLGKIMDKSNEHLAMLAEDDVVDAADPEPKVAKKKAAKKKDD